MKTQSPLLPWCFSWFLLLAGCSQPAPPPARSLQRRELSEERTLPLAGVARLLVEVPRGSITVRCDAARNDASLRIARYAEGDSAADAERRAREIHVAADRQGDVLQIRVTLPVAPQTHQVGATLLLQVPARPGFELVCDQGNVEIDGAAGDVTVRSRIGGVEASNLAGKLTVDARRGAITVREVQGQVTLRCGTGDIEAYRPGPIEASTKSGSLRVYHPQGAVKLQVERGEVLLQGPRLADEPQVQIVTVAGGVRLLVPVTVKAKLALHAGKGLVTAYLDRVAVTNRVASDNSYVALLNGGGGKIDVKTGEGPIHMEAVGTSLVR